MKKESLRLAFLGNMNNFPFNNARKLKERGWDVTFYVDVPKSVPLDRPESILATNELPAWVHELHVEDYGRKQYIKMLFPKLSYASTIRLLNKFDVVFLNGEWIKLAPFIKPGKAVMGLFAGIDLDSADYDKVEPYATSSVSNKKTAVPKSVYKLLWRRLIGGQIRGVRRVDTVNYYLPGINPQGEKILATQKRGQRYARLPLRGVETSDFPYAAHKDLHGKFIILNATRFDFTDPDRNDNKRNDIMIEGIERFLRENGLGTEQVECIFFSKGGDLQTAKELCTAKGLDPYITWQKPVPVTELNGFMARCHVSFDQLGVQWIGASGIYSMLVGRPVICNYRPDLFDAFLKVKAPICQAVNGEDVTGWLTKLYHQRQLVHDVGIASREFILNHMNIERDIDFYENFLKERFQITA